MCSVCADHVRHRVAACVLLLLLAACDGDGQTPEDRIRASIDAIVQAVEEGSPRQTVELLHPDYRDQRHPDRRSAVASLFWYTRQNRDIHLFTLVRQLDVDADQKGAQAVVYVAMTAVPVESLETLVSIRADLYRFDVRFMRSPRGEWLIASSQWQRADLGSL